MPTRDSKGRQRVGNRIIEVRRGVDALRSVRTSLVELAYEVARRRTLEGFLVLVDSTVTEKRLRQEWQSAAAVLKGEVLDRLTLCLKAGAGYRGIPRDPGAEVRAVLEKVVGERGARREAGFPRTDYVLVVLKLLIHQRLKGGGPVTAEWLGRCAGCSYPTVARALKQLGGLVERGPGRRVGLGYFGREEILRLVANRERFGPAVRFADRSGQARSVEAHVRRLEKLKVPRVALGGVLGARHYVPGLDLVGVPRLDLSLHAPGGEVDLGFVENLDPALTRESDPLKPAQVVVHLVRHADPLFGARESGLAWADPVECLMDLHEARLEPQAAQFMGAMQGGEKVSHGA